ncbi:hypothetical protein C8J56DRAFT_999941 [Mycena floridula]|nr:hypothetical protein C8J56DRAFT_999941 [Mycena floridula]
MVLSIFAEYFPFQYLVHILVAASTALVIWTFSQGRRTNRERDLHARVILVTGGFTPLGMTLLQNLAERGAHIIALTSESVESPRVAVLIDLIRSTTSNEQIYAEHCDLASPESIKGFCERFGKSEDKRLDALVFAHEYQHIGSFGMFSDNRDAAEEREVKSLATFLITTLLLPVLLVAPVGRDIRIINVVNRFYAAAAASPLVRLEFPSTLDPKPVITSTFLEEGTRALRTVIYTRHLQRILDALPTAGQVPETDSSQSSVPVVSKKVQKSNIVAVSVSPGISRADTVSLMFNANWAVTPTPSWLDTLRFHPLLLLFVKSPFAATQTILHALFLPTPFKVVSQIGLRSPSQKRDIPQGAPIDASILEMPEECAVVKLDVRKPVLPVPEKSTDKKKNPRAPEDDEFGGPSTGQLVWEAYEDALKVWDKSTPVPAESSK